MSPLRNFDTELDTAGVARLIVTKPVEKPVLRVEAPAPVVAETVTIRPKTPAVAPSAARATHLAKTDAEWGWEELRDYVVRCIERRHGPFPRNFKTEPSIFKGFLSRWGAQAPAIARYAFDVADGMWKNAPISVNRFCKGSDPYFSAEIASRLS